MKTTDIKGIQNPIPDEVRKSSTPSNRTAFDYQGHEIIEHSTCPSKILFHIFGGMSDKYIPLYKDINDLHQASGYDQRTHLDDFHIITMESTYPSVRQSMPPFRQGFYQVALLSSWKTTSIELNTQKYEDIQSPLFFVVPGQTFSWFRGDEVVKGFIVFFKIDFLPFKSQTLIEELPFLQFIESNVFNAGEEEKKLLERDMAMMLEAFEYKAHPYQGQRLKGLLFSFLYNCKAVYKSNKKAIEQQSRAAALTFRFQQIVNKLYCRMKSVADFAEQLNVTPNYLTTAVKEVTGKTAKDLINERMLTESKNLLLYTDMDVSRIAYTLNFSEPTHFTRFFKKHAGETPQKFRSIH